MLCRRSASLIISTRRSWAMATTIFRKFSACRSSRLPLLPRGEGELADLGHPVDEVGDFRPELQSQIVLGGPRILEHVVQEAGDDRGDVHLEIHEEAGGFQ